MFYLITNETNNYTITNTDSVASHNGVEVTFTVNNTGSISFKPPIKAREVVLFIEKSEISSLLPKVGKVLYGDINLDFILGSSEMTTQINDAKKQFLNAIKTSREVVSDIQGVANEAKKSITSLCDDKKVSYENTVRDGLQKIKDAITSLEKKRLDTTKTIADGDRLTTKLQRLADNLASLLEKVDSERSSVTSLSDILASKQVELSGLLNESNTYLLKFEETHKALKEITVRIE